MTNTFRRALLALMTVLLALAPFAAVAVSKDNAQSKLLEQLLADYVRQSLTMIGNVELVDYDDGFIENDAREADDLITLAQIEHNARAGGSGYEIADFDAEITFIKRHGDEMHIILETPCSLKYDEFADALPQIGKHFFVVEAVQGGFALKRHYQAGDIFFAYTGIKTGKMFNEKKGRVANIPVDLDYIRQAMDEDRRAGGRINRSLWKNDKARFALTRHP